jgi:transposase
MLAKIKKFGFTGSFSHMARFLEVELIPSSLPAVPSLLAPALCTKPRGMLTSRQAETLDGFKSKSTEFATLRALAMRFLGLLRGRDPTKLEARLRNAQRSGLYCFRRFVRTLKWGIAKVRNAISEPWSNGQTEGQINERKTLKRAMFGRAGTELLRARMLPMPRFAQNEN